jgi:hypothetical protein
MISPTLEQELHEHLHQLAIEQQRQVVDFARALAVTRVRGVPGQTLLQFAGAIEADDVATMAQAIEDGCEQVNSNEW